MKEGAFKLMVMFFGLTNSLVTFQAMMNDLLSVMINTLRIQYGLGSRVMTT